MMLKVVVMCERPVQPSAGEPTSWIRTEAGKLLGFDGLESVTVTTLRTADPTFSHVWDWLIEIEIGDGLDPAEVVEQPALAEFMAELRSLGTHPIAVLADPATAVSFSRAYMA